MLMIVLAFAVKAILPAGFMPTITQDGYTKIVVCSGMGEKTVMVPSDKTAPAPHAEKICDYQVLAGGKILISVPAMATPVPDILLGSAVPLTEQFISTQTVFSFAARGPPSA